MILLPPKVRGPLSVLSTSVTVELVLPGALIDILVNGSPIQRTNIATSNSVEIPLKGYTLPPDATVTARWSLDGEQSLPSLPESVLGYPEKLDVPIFLSHIHTCVDWIAVGSVPWGYSRNTQRRRTRRRTVQLKRSHCVRPYPRKHQPWK